MFTANDFRTAFPFFIQVFESKITFFRLLFQPFLESKTTVDEFRANPHFPFFCPLFVREFSVPPLPCLLAPPTDLFSPKTRRCSLPFFFFFTEFSSKRDPAFLGHASTPTVRLFYRSTSRFFINGFDLGSFLFSFSGVRG